MTRANCVYLAIAITTMAVSNVTTVHADQRPESNSDAKRPATKPSVVKIWRDEMRLRFQEMTGFTRYIRGETPAKYY